MLYILDYKMAHTNMKKMLDSAVLLYLMIFDIFSTLVFECWNYLMKGQFIGGNIWLRIWNKYKKQKTPTIFYMQKTPHTYNIGALYVVVME